MKIKKTKTMTPTAVAWGVACEVRRRLDAITCAQWPVDGLTKRESRKLGRALGHIAAARDEICGLQASLSERSKLSGVDNPDYITARKVNGW